MPRCSFCKTMYDFPQGTTIVQKDGTPKYLCSSKCRKNSIMGRDNRRVKWIVKNKESQAASAAEKKEREE